MDRCEQLDLIVERYHSTSGLVLSEAFPDGGTEGGARMLGIRLARAGGNQLQGDPAAISRYGIWANTVRDHVVAAHDLVHSGGSCERALEHLRLAANSLSAFADIQAILDPDTPSRPLPYLER